MTGLGVIANGGSHLIVLLAAASRIALALLELVVTSRSTPTQHDGGTDVTAISTLVLAIVTGLLVLASVFQDPITRRLGNAKLRISITAAPPETQQVTLVTLVGNLEHHEQVVYMRARVTHRGGPSAENVELVAQRVWQQTDSGWSERKNFLPMSLMWSHIRTPANRIPADLFRHCDIGHFRNYSAGATFTLETQVQPNPNATGAWPSVLPAGTYAIALLLTGDNVKPLASTWMLTFPREWSDSEEELLASISIAQIAAIPD